jgi:hypothetical protein
VAHTCNPSYSGVRDQEDHSSKPAQAHSSRDPISKIYITKKADGTLFLTKVPETYGGEKTASSSNVAGKSGYLPAEN